MERQQILLYEETKKLPEIFSFSDIQNMVNAIQISNKYPGNEWGKFLRARDKAILMTIYKLALRPKEACSLRFDDFNKENCTVKIRGENNKTKKDRLLPLPSELANFYRNYFNFSYVRFWRGSAYLFPSLERDHISPQTWKAIFREKILKPLGLWLPPEDHGTGNKTPKFRTYTLRHTRATELLNNTKDIYLVSNILGHAKLNSTKIYLHKSKDYVEYMRDCLNKMEGGKIKQ